MAWTNVPMLCLFSLQPPNVDILPTAGKYASYMHIAYVYICNHIIGLISISYFKMYLWVMQNFNNIRMMTQHVLSTHDNV